MLTSSYFITGSYSLSVRDSDAHSGDTVKHYKIRTLDNGGFYISPRNTFSTLQELVSHYKSEFTIFNEYSYLPTSVCFSLQVDL